MAIFDRFKSLFRAEGSHRGPFFGTDATLGGIHQFDPLGDGWQRNMELNAHEARHVPTIYACVMSIARSVSQCYPEHVRINSNKSIERVKTSAPFRVLRNPNHYQAGPEFLLNLVATALFEGEAFAVVTRNDRSEINSIHPLQRGSCYPMVDAETKEIFYSISSDWLVDKKIDYIAPARDVLHLKFHTPRSPLIGESPIKAAALAAGINVSLSKSQAAFFENMSRPSGVLSTDMQLNAQQMHQLRAAFNEQSKMWAQGGIPILGNGLKFQQLAVSSQDAQLVQAQRMSVEEICRVFGVPPPLVGDLSHATLNNTETLISHFLSMSLGSYLETLERTLDRLFRLPNNEYIELDTAALLRTNFEERVTGLTKAVQGGLMTPDEARAREGLSPVTGGDGVFMQAQMTPVDLLNQLHAANIASKVDGVEAEPKVPERNEPDKANPEVAKAFVVSMMEYKRKQAS